MARMRKIETLIPGQGVNIALEVIKVNAKTETSGGKPIQRLLVKDETGVETLSLFGPSSEDAENGDEYFDVLARGDQVYLKNGWMTNFGLSMGRYGELTIKPEEAEEEAIAA